MNVKEHETCMCGATEVQLALFDERERLSEIVEAWITKVNEALGTDISTDGLLFDCGWFPIETYCKLEIAD